jgi:hypothetical protein
MSWIFYNSSGQRLSSAAPHTAPVFGRVVRTGGNVTTTSTSLEDVTDATITFTTGAFPVRYSVVQSARNDTQASQLRFNVDVDGTLLHGTTGTIMQQAVAALWVNLSFSGTTAALTAGEHTIKLQWSVSANTGTILAASGDNLMWSAEEIR